MATKINTTYWGTYDPSSGFNAYQAQYNISNLIRDNKYDPVSPEFDLTVAPWGMGLCNAANVTTALWFRDGTPTSTSGNSLVRVAAVDSASGNTPLVLVTGTHFETESESGYYRYISPSQRIGGQTSKDSSDCVISKCKFDLNDRIAGYSPNNTNYLVGTIKPYAYIKYTSVKIRPRSFTWINLNTGVLKTVSMAAGSTDWATFQSDTAALSIDDIAITRIEYAYCSKGWVAPNWTDATNVQMQQLTPIPVDADLKQLYFSDNNIEEYIPLSGINIIGTTDSSGHETMNGARIDGARRLPIDNTNYSDCTYKDSDIQQVGNLWNSTLGRKLNHYTENTWSFDDISYTTKGTIYQVINNSISYVEAGHQFNTDQYYFAIFTTIESSTYNSVADSVKALILHELAFIGFPIIFERSYYDSEVGSAGVYLPIFDNNQITTGEFLEGTESLNLPNATWQDIFDSSMPNYDPNYRPTPDPGEEDRGDLENQLPRRFGTSGTKKFVCSENTINALQQYLNGTYLPTDAHFIEDFKGTNPQDYIVSIQRYPYPISHLSQSKSHIFIGSIDTNLEAYPLYDAIYTPQQFTAMSRVSFGDIEISNFFGDFRDFQSKITLLMPFIGSVDLDPRLYIGHSVGLIYNIDYDTGAVCAEVKRDGLTIETKTATISITVPFFAANMGAYQNALAATQFAIEQSKVKQIAGIASTAISAGGAIATGGAASDTAQLGIAGGVIGGAASMITGYIQQQQLEYQLEHTAPAMGTISVSSPANAFLMDDRARIIISRPRMLAEFDETQYGHTVGYACSIAAPLGSFEGYVVAGACDLSGIAATAEEKRLIKKQLAAGVYI